MRTRTARGRGEPIGGTLSRSGIQCLSYALGLLVLGLAATTYLTGQDTTEVIAGTVRIFGTTFLAAFAGLVLGALFCWIRLQDKVTADDRQFWLGAGMHAASGVATLALTYTLLGISLGIGELADQDLNPETVRAIVRELTGHFSLAFLTTVVGLPTAAALRALLWITASNIERKGAVRPALAPPSDSHGESP
jgi:hypothetical protein